MNRKEFMEQLRRLLYDIPARDKEEALAYYEGYFDDAGAENEAAVIRELGSPGRIAAEIKAGLLANPEEGEYTDTGYHHTDREREHAKDGYRPVRYGQKKQQERKQMSNGVKTLMLIGLAVVTFPIWGSLLGVACSLILGVFGMIFGIVAGSLFGGIALVIGSIVLVVFAIANMPVSLSLTLAILGLGMILMAVGLLLLVGFGWLVRKAIPALIRFLVDLFHRIFNRNKREAV